MTNLLFVVIVCIHSHVITSSNTNVCSDNLNQGPRYPRPKLTANFEMHVDCLLVERNQSTEVHEYYDYEQGQGLITQTTAGVTTLLQYDDTLNELVIFHPDSDLCTVSDLSKSKERLFFRYNTPGASSPGHGRIFSPAAALHFSGRREVYEGRDKIRGINVLKWTYCQYWADLDATINVTWYYSDRYSWDMPLAWPSVPVRAWVRGVVKNTNHVFNHYYDFLHFVPYVLSPDVFNLQSFVTCSGGNLTKQIPQLSPASSFSVEILDVVSEDVSYQKEWHDETLKLTKFTHTPTITSGSGEFGYRPLTEIHDFNTGVAYITDDERGNCTYRRIEETSLDAFVKDPAHIRMRTAREFFRLNSVNLTYEGVKTTRGVRGDVYTARVPDYHNATVEWFFKENKVTFVQEERSTFKGGNPVQVRARIPQLNQEFTLNIYNYVESEADIVHWDIRQCYPTLNIRRFQVTVPEVYSKAISSNPEKFKYALLQTLSQKAQVFPLRIAGIRVTIQKNVTVQFDLLDVTPIDGDVGDVTQTSLEAAASTLRNVITSGRFVVLMSASNEQKPTAITVIPSSLTELIEGSTTNTKSLTTEIFSKILESSSTVQVSAQTTTLSHVTNTPPSNQGTSSALGLCDITSSGYSGGVAIGVSAGMLVLGGVLGTAVAFYMKRNRRFRGFFNKERSMTDLQVHNPNYALKSS